MVMEIIDKRRSLIEMYEKKNENLLRWDNYFLNMCKLVSTNSQCLSRQIGTLLVKDKRIITTGYNGPPSGVRRCDERWYVDKDICEKAGIEYSNNLQKEVRERITNLCPRYLPEMGFKSGEGLEWCVAGHAERNSLINAARMGIKTKKCKLYMSCGIPCTPCLVESINGGISEIIITKLEFYDISAKYLLQESNLKVRIFSPLCEHDNQFEKKGISNNTKNPGHCSDCGMEL